MYALLTHKVGNTIVAGIVDAEAVKLCREKGVGKEITLSIGGKQDTVFGKPLDIKGKIEFVSSDSLMNTNRGAVVIDVQGVKTVLLNARRSFTSLRDFNHAFVSALSQHEVDSQINKQ